MKIRLKVKTLYISTSSYRCGLQQGEKYCSLKFIFEQIESWKADRLYAPLGGHPPSPQLVNQTCPSLHGEGFLFICLLKQLYFIC